MEPKFLFIVGAHKTGTSTLQSILNCHPDILMLYEYLNHFPRIGNHDRTYNNDMDDALASIFSKIRTRKRDERPDITSLMTESRDIFCKDKEYKYFGSKWAGFNGTLADVWSKHKAIYTVRDIRTWMAKESINTMFLVRKNKEIFTRTAVDYAIQFVKTFNRPNCLRVTMEDIVQNTDEVIRKIGRFVDIDLLSHTANWRDKIGKYDDSIKLMVPDWEKHYSSFSTSGTLDTAVEMSEKEESWNTILEVFDKYYHNLDVPFEKREVVADIKKLKTIKRNRDLHTSYKLVYKARTLVDIIKDVPERQTKLALTNASMLGSGATNKSWPNQWYSDGTKRYPIKAWELSGDLGRVAKQHILPGHVPAEPIIPNKGKILTLGSCFAEVLRAHMRKNKMSAYNVWIPSGLHNTYAMYDFLHWVFKGEHTSDGFRYDRLDDGTIVDWMPEEEHRIYNEAFMDTDAIILTIGLAETWRDKYSGKVFWRGIPENLFDNEKHEFYLSTVDDNTQNLKKTIGLIREYRPDVTIILTLSPVPLKATFRDVSCITADCVSKSTLRVAINNVMSELYKDVYYWPSFEIVRWLGAHQGSAMFGRDDKSSRHVNKKISSKIVALFMESFVKE